MNNICTVNNRQPHIGIFNLEAKLIIGTTIDTGKSVDITFAEGEHTDHHLIGVACCINHRHRLKGLFN